MDDRGVSAKDKTTLGDGVSVIVGGANRYGPTDKILLKIDDINDNRRETFIRLYTDDTERYPFVANDDAYKASVLKKFLGSIYDDGQRQNYNNTPLYRYADVVLMLAEAKNNLKEDPSAEINAVRRRAYEDKFEDYRFVNGDQASNRKAILDERLKEFIGEGKRWWDVVRAGEGLVFEELDALDASEAYKIYYPITQEMLANDDQLTQTEGYK